MRRIAKLFVTTCALAVFATTVQADSIIAFWNEIALRAVRNGSLGPPMVARALAMVHTATYDAWAAYDAKAVGTRYGGALRQHPDLRTLANKEKAVSHAAFRVLMDLYPAQSNLLTSTMTALGYDPNNTSTEPNTPEGIGNLVAQNLLEFRHNDGANQLGNMLDTNGVVVTNAYGDTTGYQPVNTPTQINDPNRWQPLTFSNGLTPRFLAPHWGRVLCFALTNGAQLRPPPPPLYPSARYKTEAREILQRTARLNDRQKVIAEYWADGPRSETPPGHWNLFAQAISERDGHGIDQDAKMFFALNCAELDASVAVWEAKVFYDFVRPITAIQFLNADRMVTSWRRDTNGNRLRIPGSEWVPYQPGTFLTPPFAEYTSGHSAFSAAGAQILKSFTGSDRFDGRVTIPAGFSRIESNVPARDIILSWPTFSAAADQAAISRRYGGIHFRSGDMESRKLGRAIGKLVWEKAQTYFDGTAPPPP